MLARGWWFFMLGPVVVAYTLFLIVYGIAHGPVAAGNLHEHLWGGDEDEGDE